MTDAEIVDAEIVDTVTPPAPTLRHVPQNAPSAPLSLFGDVAPAEVVKRASETAEALMAVIEQQELYKVISDRRYVFVEGWTLLGSMVGVYAVLEATEKITDADGQWREPIWGDGPCGNCDGTGKYRGRDKCYRCDGTGTAEVVVEPGAGGWQARVVARRTDGTIVGAAEAECRWTERTWRNRDSYALRSMAQTRARSRALRDPLDFIVRLAGFDTTPAEEIDGRVEADIAAKAQTQRPKGPGCPACGSAVWDNRADHQATPKRPAWRCRNKKCTGGKTGDDGKQWPWASWDPHEFEARIPRPLPPEEWEAAATWVTVAIAEIDEPTSEQLVNLAKGYCAKVAGGVARNAQHLYETVVAERYGDDFTLADRAELESFVQSVDEVIMDVANEQAEDQYPGEGYG